MTRRELRFTNKQRRTCTRSKRPREPGLLKQVRKTLGLMETNLRHPSLATHKYESLPGPNGEDAFEAYAQNLTGGAYRVFCVYGTDRKEGRKRITVPRSLRSRRTHRP